MNTFYTFAKPDSRKASKVLRDKTRLSTASLDIPYEFSVFL
jgi:hypothetical protein